MQPYRFPLDMLWLLLKDFKWGTVWILFSRDISFIRSQWPYYYHLIPGMIHKRNLEWFSGNVVTQQGSNKDLNKPIKLLALKLNLYISGLVLENGFAFEQWNLDGQTERSFTCIPNDFICNILNSTFSLDFFLFFYELFGSASKLWINVMDILQYCIN